MERKITIQKQLPESELMTPIEVMSYLHISRPTLNKLVANNLLAQYGIGYNLRRYKRVEVINLLERMRIKS